MAQLQGSEGLVMELWRERELTAGDGNLILDQIISG